MTAEPIKFVPQQASGQDALGGAMPIAMNIVVDQAGVIRKRPGVRLMSDGPQTALNGDAVSGIHRALSGDIYAVTETGAERPIFRINGSGATVLSGGVPPGGLRGTGRPVFAETEMLLVLAGGAEMQKVELATFVSSRLGGSPPLASSVIAKSLRLLANDVLVDRTKIRYSDISQGTTTFAGHETWLPGAGNDSGFFTAESRPDPVVALADTAELVFVLGSNTIEGYLPDPVQRFAKVSVRDVGLHPLAPHAFTKIEQDVYLFDNRWRVLKGGDRGFDVISGPIQKTLDDIDPTGAFAYRVESGPVDVAVFDFPTIGQAFAYSPGVGWSQWSSWDGQNYEPFIVNCLDDCELVGTRDGFVGEFSMDAHDDMGRNIRCYVESGFQGDGRWRDCKKVLLGFRRGATAGSDAPVALFSWRDNRGEWEAPIPVDLGAAGDTEIVVELAGLGSYRYRQWRLEFTSSEELSLVSAVEYFEVTES